MVDEQKVAVGYGLPTLPCGLHFPLRLDDIFSQDEADLQEAFHDAEGNGNIVLVAAGVADEDGAMASGLKHSVAFFRYIAHSV